MNPDQDTLTLIFICVFICTSIILLYQVRKQRRSVNAPPFLMVKVDGQSLKMIRKVRQRCEHKNEVEVIQNALALYDTATESVQKGGKITIGGEELNLFPLNRR